MAAKREPERLFTIAEAAALWSCSRDTIERLIERGELRVVRLSTVRRIPASSLVEYAARNVERVIGGRTVGLVS